MKFRRGVFVSRQVGSIFWTGIVLCSFQKVRGVDVFCVVQRSAEEIFVCAETELTLIVQSDVIT